MSSTIQLKAYLCEHHPEQLLNFSQKEPNSNSALYCFECISKDKVDNYVTFNKIFKSSEEEYKKIRPQIKVNETLSEECLSLILIKDQILYNLKIHIEEQKSKIDKFHDDLLQNMIEILAKYRMLAKENLEKEMKYLEYHFDFLYNKYQIYAEKQVEIEVVPSFNNYILQGNQTQSLSELQLLVERAQQELAEFKNISSSENMQEAVEKCLADYTHSLKETSDQISIMETSLGKDFTLDDIVKSFETIAKEKVFTPGIKLNKSLRYIKPKIECSISSNLDFILSKIGAIQNCQLLYRMTRDGSQSGVFHSKCDNKGPTITVIKSNTGNIFGGYSKIAWDSSGQWKASADSFLFSLNGQHIFKCVTPNYSIFCHSNYGPTFGGNHDLHLSQNFVNQTCTINFGNGYENKGLGQFFANGNVQAFTCAEVEVLLIS